MDSYLCIDPGPKYSGVAVFQNGICVYADKILSLEALKLDFHCKVTLVEKIEARGNIIGNSTNESIHSGVINGLVNEIDGFIDYYKTLNANFIIILTGGDADFLAIRLKNTIFANPNFLLESLNQTFQYNQK